MKYVLTRQAEEDLIEIYLYGLKVFGPLQAEKYHHSIEKAFERIAENHKMFPLALHIREGYRYCVHISHTIFFTVEDRVRIVRIIGKQKFP
ncbi:type II toxin-antitoxin system RelE/ParE family toxin [Cyclobacterium jeungdonense]|uniref:Type II toxin-antitoxin system RelE/ParE family toxin n=1 Tax=Cyclobacterium jeungdonense TaxID=708087 RepID=A0ABT8CCI1_9BACT|nr:type II toxin-antitoxin system RelE/ParE family toxin [Cyclobacterium jeungdonense]MDN3690230.1 type II toxin-antitoxin system RelE/ParE family toxin [Cyclobacterium jeungdonense]